MWETDDRIRILARIKQAIAGSAEADKIPIICIDI